MSTVSVLVPTYRRVTDLARCLSALELQERQPDRVVVVYRDTDAETREFLDSRRWTYPFLTVAVSETGVVAALNAGLDRISSGVAAITDDDAAPRPDWLARIEAHFDHSPDVGGVGGRDYILARSEPDSARVGIIQWFGRQIGNHHVGIGPVRDVHMLKGVNMSFRMTAVGATRLDTRLRGSGAQVHNELAFCIAIRAKGWRLIYDPKVAVDHFTAQRFDEDQRSNALLVATRNAAFNETLILLEHFAPVRKAVFLTWAFLLGARDLPGLGQCVRLRGQSWYRFPHVAAGRLEALRYHLFVRRPASEPRLAVSEASESLTATVD
jgi:GT2 family glycosyltransferase